MRMETEMTEKKSYGQAAYESYVNFNDRTGRNWIELSDESRERWSACSQAVLDYAEEQRKANLPAAKLVRQVPSVNRAVIYFAYGTPGGEYPAKAQRAAIITEVDYPGQPESSVSLCVLNPTGIFFNTHCPYGRMSGGWQWPEYIAPVAAE